MTKIRIGIIGFGTVGTGVYKSLKDFDNVEVVKIAVKNINKPRSVEVPREIMTDNPLEISENPDIDVVVELMGGVEPAWSYIKSALEHGKHIVTANKELLAKKGEELFNLSEEKNCVVLYEAAIAGGIPIIMPIKTILAGNKINRLQGILNGTTNYILTKMDADGASYEDVLKEAQQLGYAETDPTGDVEGFDAAYKITTLATIAFNFRVKFEDVYREGITKIRKQDMKNANELGYKIKLIASATIDENNNADVRVHPMLVPKTSMLAHIDYVTNAIALNGHPMGSILLSGPGAGEFPTASSVIGDILAIAREYKTTDYLLPMMRCHHHSKANPVQIENTYNKYYLSITAPNAIGVIAKIGTICANKDISLSSILQKGVGEDNTADITVITEKCLEKSIKEVITELTDCEVNSLIRVAE
ncbi:MAG: homoserine dehydrogenase [bacterium]|nr:homoserine dehydrogenase [bacterium]